MQRLGPALLQIAKGPTDVACLDSFSSQIFARQGNLGYGQDEEFLALLHAQLQPRLIFEGTLLAEGRDAHKVLVLVDCAVATAPVERRILDLQKRGGMVIGDPNLALAIKPDTAIPRYVRTKTAAEDVAAVLVSAFPLR